MRPYSPLKRKRAKGRKKAKRTVPRARVVEQIVEREGHIYHASEWERGDEVRKILLLQIVIGKKKREFKALYSVKIFPTHIVVKSVNGKNYTTKVIPLTGKEEIVVKEWRGYTWEKP